MIKLVHCCGHFRELSCSFGVVRVMFGITKRVTSLSSGLVGDNSGVWWAPAVRVVTFTLSNI